MEYKPHSYQIRATNRIIDQKRIGLFLDMGLGKTVITLTAVKDLIENFEVWRVLVIAPKRVAEDTWSREYKKWDHLKGLKISKVIGTPRQRVQALKTEANVYVIGRDNVKWLVGIFNKDNWPFDMVVIDELSSFKNPQAQRFKALRKVIPMADRVVGLTGTPSPNGMMDLWAEIYLLDRGKRLESTLSCYREKYFRPGLVVDHVVYRWDLLPGAKEKIENKISDICLSMNAEDYLELPDRIDNEIKVKLSDKEYDTYRKMELEQVLSIDEKDVVALNAAAVMNKLLQMANGAVYSDNEEVIRIHDKKLEALEEIADVSDEPILVFYSYRHDLSAIKSKFKDARELKDSNDIKDWNEGKIKMIVAHPASVGYGLNIQEGGHTIVWYGLTWSLELYQQANARLFRQGQQHTVIIHHLITEGTVDENVMTAIKKKDTSQSALLEALKERR